MHRNPDSIGNRMHIVGKTDRSYQREPRQEPRILKPVERRIKPHPEKEYNSAAAKRNPVVRTPLIGLVDNIETVGDPKIKQLYPGQQNQDKQ